jgi:hypothetical protein
MTQTEKITGIAAVMARLKNGNRFSETEKFKNQKELDRMMFTQAEKNVQNQRKFFEAFIDKELKPFSGIDAKQEEVAQAVHSIMRQEYLATLQHNEAIIAQARAGMKARYGEVS